MTKEYLKSIIDCVSGIECKHETQQIAKYELIEHVEDLQERINKAIEYIEKYTHEIEGITGHYYTISDTEYLLEILKGGIK